MRSQSNTEQREGDVLTYYTVSTSWLSKKHFTRYVSLEIQLQLIKIEETRREEGFSEKARKNFILSYKFRLGSTEKFHSDFTFATAEQEDDLFVGFFFQIDFLVFFKNWHADRRSR